MIKYQIIKSNNGCYNLWLLESPGPHFASLKMLKYLTTDLEESIKLANVKNYEVIDKQSNT